MQPLLIKQQNEKKQKAKYRSKQEQSCFYRRIKVFIYSSFLLKSQGLFLPPQAQMLNSTPQQSSVENEKRASIISAIL